MRSRHWRVYEVQNATPIVDGPGVLQAMGPDWLSADAHGGQRPRPCPRPPLPGADNLVSGRVSRAGQYIRVTVRSPEKVRLNTSFSLSRIGATSPRCTQRPGRRTWFAPQLLTRYERPPSIGFPVMCRRLRTIEQRVLPRGWTDVCRL